LASGLVGVILSWPLARYCALVFKLPIKHLKSILLSVVIASLVYLAMTKSMLWYYVIVILVFAPIGYWLRNRDVIPLIFAFIFAKLSMTIFERIMI
jgi:TctA family transporter